LLDKHQKIFSIITPVYNCEEYIRETVDSVLNHIDTRHTEYIIVDDGSTDETLRILKTYGSKIILISQENMGEAAAVNRGLIESSSEYIMVVSADDPMISSEWLQEAAQIMHNNKNLVCAYPDWQIIDDTGAKIRTVVSPNFSRVELIEKLVCLVGPGGVFRKSAAIAIGGRRQKFKYVSDYDFWLRLSTQGDFIKCEGIRAQWREHPGSTSISDRSLSMAKERIEVIENFLFEFPQPLKSSRRARANSYYHAALLTYFDSSIPGRRWMWKSLYFSKFSVKDFDLRIVIYLLAYPLSYFGVSILKKIGLFELVLRKLHK